MISVQMMNIELTTMSYEATLFAVWLFVFAVREFLTLTTDCSPFLEPINRKTICGTWVFVTKKAHRAYFGL